MAKHEEGGRYAIAGFLYQLIGTGFEAFAIYGDSADDGIPTELLVVERFGQDAAVLPIGGSTKKPRLIQYKYSSTDAKIKPKELQKILQRFLKSVGEVGRPLDEVEFELITNRDYSPTLVKLEAAVTNGDRAKVERLIRGSSREQISELEKLVTICFALKRKLQNQEHISAKITEVGANIGMFENEIDEGTNNILGLLMRLAEKSGPRIVKRKEIHKAFTDHPLPFELLSKDSIKLRRDDTEEFKRRETNGCVTIPRHVAEEIARSAIEHSVTVVVGDGGCGKSIAVADAVAICLADRAQPPGFALVVPAMEAKREFIMNAVARWRHFEPHLDGQDLDRSITRLQRAFDKEPLLMVCIEAIDEKEGKARLPSDSQTLLNELIHQAVVHHQQHGIPRISVVISCRRVEELRHLSRGDEFSRPYKLINVTAFDDEELASLARPLDASVRDRLVNHFATSVLQTRNVQAKSERTVSRDSLEIIRHPRVWRYFAELSANDQHECLDGVHCLDKLAMQFLKWFCAKAEIRHSLRTRECSLGLLAVSHRFSDSLTRPAERDRDWIAPFASKCGNDRNAWDMFDEALSAGIIVEEEAGGRTWRWKQHWLCDYMIRNGIDRL